MYKHVSISIDDKANFPQATLKNLLAKAPDIIKRKLNEASNFSGVFSNSNLSLTLSPADTFVSGRIDDIVIDDMVRIQIDINPKRSWSFNEAAVNYVFLHELGHSIFDIDQRFMHVALKHLSARDLRHHIEYRADSFAANIDPNAIEIIKEGFDQSATTVAGQETLDQPSTRNMYNAVQSKAYDGILSKNLDQARSLSERGKGFGSFVDYIKNRSHIKETIDSIERL